MSKFKTGDRVVPKKKSLFSALEFSSTWKNAQKLMQPYLYVINILAKSDGTYYTCDEMPEGDGDFFLESDLIPYKEQSTKVPVAYKKSAEMDYRCTVCEGQDPCYRQCAPDPTKPNLCPFVEKHYLNWHPVDRGEGVVASVVPEVRRPIWYALQVTAADRIEPDYKGFYEFMMEDKNWKLSCGSCVVKDTGFCTNDTSCLTATRAYAENKFIKRDEK